jgi:hypothetical protein
MVRRRWGVPSCIMLVVSSGSSIGMVAGSNAGDGAGDGACTLAIRYDAGRYCWSNQGIGLWLND